MLIAGGGPTGMMLAAELTLAGVDAAIIEQRPTPELVGSRAGGFHSRTIEILDQRGIAERFLSEGTVAQTARFGNTVLDIGDFPTPHPYGLGLWQNHVERILASWVDELGVRVYRGREVTGFAQDETGVDAQLADGQIMRARYLVGADGGRSVIRKSARIDFPGWDPTYSSLIAEVEFAEEPEWGLRVDALGVHGISRLEDGPARVVVRERSLELGEATLEDLRTALVQVWGTDYAAHSPRWISRFTDTTRQAATYRDRRVLLAGDSAHVHAPAGGQGIGLGVQDAVNLGWKLAQVIKGTSPETLLDSYHAERHPVTARALRHTMAQTAIMRGDDRTAALGDTLAELLTMDEPRTRVAAMIHGLDTAYDLGEGHPLLGRRVPDLSLDTTAGPLRVFTLLHDARPVLLNLGEPDAFDITAWADRVRLVDASYDGTWQLPVLGAVTPPSAVLIRPDGHVAWVGTGTRLGLTEALMTWFGTPIAP
ncbi:MAG TPA: FAD-dependent monooxygenase [Jatrophihabitans sp.]